MVKFVDLGVLYFSLVLPVQSRWTAGGLGRSPGQGVTVARTQEPGGSSPKKRAGLERTCQFCPRAQPWKMWGSTSATPLAPPETHHRSPWEMVAATCWPCCSALRPQSRGPAFRAGSSRSAAARNAPAAPAFPAGESLRLHSPACERAGTCRRQPVTLREAA